MEPFYYDGWLIFTCYVSLYVVFMMLGFESLNFDNSTNQRFSIYNAP